MTSAPAFLDFAGRLRQFMSRSLAPNSPQDGSLEGHFQTLALQLFALQFEHNGAYRQICEARGLSPASVTRWPDIPAVPARVFKELEVTSLPASARTTVFHSSGTTAGRPARHFHSDDSLMLYEASLVPWFRRHLLPDWNGAAEFFSLTPPVAMAPHSSLVHMLAIVSREFGSGSSCFCGGVDEQGAWNLNQNYAETMLARAQAVGRPVVLLGTAFNFVHLLDGLAAGGRRFALPEGSRVLETGGYKGRSRSLAKEDLHRWISDSLGVRPEWIVCEYGMSELSSQAYDRIAGGPADASGVSRVFHFPPWARVRVVSPETGREVRDGETGLLQIFDLANVFSVLAVQTEDLGVRRASGFELLGRAALAEPRGCSLMPT